jgi:hypothetical protein
MAKVTVSDLKRVKTENFDGSKWFSKENKRFFSDISYKVMVGKKSHKLYLVRSTYGWSGDLFGGNRAIHWCINSISESLEVGDLIERTVNGKPHPKGHVFSTYEDIKNWLKEN